MSAKALHSLAVHHGTAPQQRQQLLSRMGRSDYYQGGWQKDQGGRGSRYWHGVWSPSYRKGKGDGKDPKFPRYDAKKIENPNAPSSGVAPQPELAVQTEGNLIGALQAHINAARKAESRVASLTQLRKQRVAQWSAYETDLQKSYCASLPPEGNADAQMQTTDPDWERLTRPATQDSANAEVEALTRLLGPDVRLWGRKLAALEGTGPPPGLERTTHPVPTELPFGGKSEAPRDLPADPGPDPFLLGASGASSTTTEGQLDANETSGIASPGTRPRSMGTRTSVKAHTPPQFGRPDRPTLETKLEARRAALLAETRRPPDTDDGQKPEKPRPGSVLVDDDDGMEGQPSSDNLETLSAMS